MTLGWNDIARTQDTGLVAFGGRSVRIRPEHLAQWKEDPDGRFKLKVSAASPSVLELETFFPSL